MLRKLSPMVVTHDGADDAVNDDRGDGSGDDPVMLWSRRSLRSIPVHMGHSTFRAEA